MTPQRVITMYKTIIVFVAIAFVVSATQDSDPEILGSKVNDLLRKLKNVIESPVTNARNKIRTAETHVRDTAAEVKAKTSASIATIKCAEQLVTQALGYVTDGINKINTVVSDVINIEAEIENCGVGVKSVVCLAKLAVKIEEDIVRLPVQVEKDAVRVVDIVENFVPKIKSCASQGLLGLLYNNIS